MEVRKVSANVLFDLLYGEKIWGTHLTTTAGAVVLRLFGFKNFS